MTSANQHNATLKDVPAQSFINFYARHLQRAHKVPLPKWADIVKTGIHKELAPLDNNWFYIRMAAVARRLYLRDAVGIGALTKIFGGAKKNGVRPSHFVKGSEVIARTAVKALEKLKLAEIVPKKGGRRLTPAGRRELDQIAKRVITQLRSKRAVPVAVQQQQQQQQQKQQQQQQGGGASAATPAQVAAQAPTPSEAKAKPAKEKPAKEKPAKEPKAKPVKGKK